MTSCLVCAGATTSWGIKNGYRILRCPDCGHGFVETRPSPTEITQIYATSDPRFVKGNREAAYWAEMPLWREPREIQHVLARLGVGSGRLLDVGAGRGRHVEYFSKVGYECVAVEPNPYFAKEIELRSGAKVVEGYLDASTTAELSSHERFDAVLLAEVIEHLVDPEQVIKQCTHLLRRGGVLVVVMPNFRSLLIKVLGAREGHICPPEHLNFFTPGSMEVFAKRLGYRLATTYTRSNITVGSTASGIQRYLGVPGWIATAMALTTSVALDIADRVGMGRYLYAYLVKE